MNNSSIKNNKVKLGKRLQSIEKMVDGEYDHIWDCCCDHGLLGFQLLENNKAKHLHFVDVVAPLMHEIENKLQRFYQGESKWSVHCLDVAKLPLAQYQNDKHLIIIAGVGGELLTHFLSALLPATSKMNVQFLLSPVHHNYQLRAFLQQHKCHLLDEKIVAENKRFYELIYIESPILKLTSTNHSVSLVGDKMWDFENPMHQTYLQQTIEHYQRMSKNPDVGVSNIIKAYQDLLPSV
ncbi:tRNA (adenine(22)-N(1))-methyltransferase [Psychromonas sp. KJ10-10]|uniref:tRNA (adenine(22)-N(1))-methyltransferase n=1 Tax=Psychromonas sp. KJ10-10 TaxID=3391823 RepID=UPI0039B4A7E8